MSTIRAARVVGRGKLEFVETPVPVLQPGQALVRPLLLTFCGSDVHMCYHSDEELYPLPIGTTGHEMVGVVEAVNGAAPGIAVGDLTLTLAPEHRALAELYAAPIEHVIPLPNGWPLDHLLMAQPLGTVIYACKQLPNLVDRDVVVLGQGAVGLFWDVMLRRMGARRVIGVDPVAVRAAAGRRFGATHTLHNGQSNGRRSDEPLAAVREILGGQLADLVVEAAGELETIDLAPQLVKPGGHLCFFGIPRTHRFEFDFARFHRRYCHTFSIAGAPYELGCRSFRLALEMVADGQVDVEPLLTHRLPFERAAEGLELARTRGDGVLKVVIEMPGYARDAR
ncbi:MAG: zinc-binding dehydrogenase [Chloroflexi bacterium]|nr:zinc-binding dehydrogenase [Chloroflexota bacterium]